MADQISAVMHHFYQMTFRGRRWDDLTRVPSAGHIAIAPATPNDAREKTRHIFQLVAGETNNLQEPNTGHDHLQPQPQLMKGHMAKQGPGRRHTLLEKIRRGAILDRRGITLIFGTALVIVMISAAVIIRSL